MWRLDYRLHDGRHAHKTLRMRGDVMHTFGALLAPLAVALVVLGFYLLGSAVAHPLTADSMSLILASILLALGFVLLSYLLRTAMALRHSMRAAQTRPRQALSQESGPPAAGDARDERPTQVLPFQRSSADSARIRH